MLQQLWPQLLDIIVFILPIYSYIDQYITISQQRSIGSFSIYVTGFSIMSSILRIFYYYHEPYSGILLIQGSILIALQLILIRKCVQLQAQTYSKSNSQKQFWKWPQLIQYVHYSIVFSIFIGILMYISLTMDLPFIANIINYASLVTQLLVSLPQIYSNYQQKSTRGLSKTMILSWVIGDSLTAYFVILNDQPLSFIIGGILIVGMDFFVLGQIYYYSPKDIQVQFVDGQVMHKIKFQQQEMLQIL